ncbi:MAG: universal stress protein [Leptolyngbyaceae cyanobacterium SM2_3_12]|nr:universal stress protein [Leptolyngbyaceae cyanobacterium SM2_3_12]
MFKKILVALDSSDQRQGLLAQAVTLAQATQAQLMLTHVLSAYEKDSPGIPTRSYQAYYPVLDDATWKAYQLRWQEFEAKRLAQLQAEIEVAQKAGVQAEFSLLSGEPAAVICNVAKSWEADLILVGSRGRKGLSELLLGSVSNHVMHHAPCSVLVVHGNAVPGNQPVSAEPVPAEVSAQR